MARSRRAVGALKVALLVMFGAWVAGCHGVREQKPLQAVKVEAVTPVVSQAPMPYSGSALAQTQVDLSFKVGGYVHSLAMTKDKHGRSRPLQAGDKVTRGMVLAALRDSDYKAKLAELSGMRNDAAASYARARQDLQRATTLLASGSISQADYDAAKARYDSSIGATAAANARVGEASIALSDSKPKAPFDGIVVNRGVEVGSLVGPGTVAFSIADTSTMRVIFAVPDSVQRGLQVDQPVTITTDAFPGRTFTGALSKIAVQADAKTRSFDVEATVDNQDGALKVGMVMLIHLAPPAPANTQTAAQNALIPLSAVIRPPTGQTGFAAYTVVSEKDGSEVVHTRRLVLGDLVSNRVTVTSGLNVGERVVVQGATLLTDGQHVTIVP